jgi:uncharacterized protein YcbK (DUF882 family)
MKISNNFSMGEFSASATAKAQKINNDIPASIHPAIVALVKNILQPLRTETGWAINITSGYRSAELNKAVGGVETSQHRTGEAADIVATSTGGRVPVIDMARMAKKLNLSFDQMILYPTFLHLSYTTKRSNRGQILYNSSYKGNRL